jgi:beta-glucanase (GH16 family)
MSVLTEGKDMVRGQLIFGSTRVAMSMMLGLSGLSITTTASGQTQSQAAAPVISLKPALAGAEIVSIASSSPKSTIYYTLDGTDPKSSSIAYLAPFLIASDVTVKAYVVVKGGDDSAVTTQEIATKVQPGSLVWSDEFNGTTRPDQQPDPKVWTYDTGHSGYGNHELEHYCAWGSSITPCNLTHPNAYVGTDGNLHIVAQQPAKGVYTSSRLKTEGLFSFRYGRIEARIKSPEAQGMWPAFWTLGNNTATTGWPGAGEQDIMERVNSALDPDWNEGSIHGIGFTGDVGLGTKFFFPHGQTAAGWHTYGMIWKKDSVSFYIDDPAKPYITYTNPESITKFPGAIWPFDGGDSAYVILNLAIGGDWPKNPDAKTEFPASLLVDYVRLYAN